MYKDSESVGGGEKMLIQVCHSEAVSAAGTPNALNAVGSGVATGAASITDVVNTSCTTGVVGAGGVMYVK